MVDRLFDPVRHVLVPRHFARLLRAAMSYEKEEIGTRSAKTSYILAKETNGASSRQAGRSTTDSATEKRSRSNFEHSVRRCRRRLRFEEENGKNEKNGIDQETENDRGRKNENVDPERYWKNENDGCFDVSHDQNGRIRFFDEKMI